MGQPFLDHLQVLAQLGVGAGGHQQLEKGREQRRGEAGPQQVDGGRDAVTVGGELGRLVVQVLADPAGQVLDRGRDQLGLGGEVVELGPSGHAGPLRDHRGRGVGVAEIDEAVDGGVEQAGPGLRAPLLLGPPDLAVPGQSRHRPEGTPVRNSGD